MKPYDAAAQASTYALIKNFSTSFGSATRLLPRSMRQHIYNIYGLVRLADEIVDGYTGSDAPEILAGIEHESYAALRRGYSPNIIIHAFVGTANRYGIDSTLLQPFFRSMRTDVTGYRPTPAQYRTYIHGSAEVVGLMCLKVFCNGDQNRYQQLQPGACALGAAFQKINFLRDIAEDWLVLGRYYFPQANFEKFNDRVKNEIIADIEGDLKTAGGAIDELPREVRRGVRLAYVYYQTLLDRLKATPAAQLKKERVRIGDYKKFLLAARVFTGKNGGQ